MLFAATYWSGLKPVFLEDLRMRLGRIEVRRTLIGRRHDALIFDYAGPPGALLGVRSAENVFALCEHFEGIGVSRDAGLRRIREVADRCRFSDALRVVGEARGQAPSDRPRVLLTVNMLGRHKFQDREVRRILRDAIQHGLGQPVAPGDHEVNVRFQLVRDKGFVGLQVPRRPMKDRAYKVCTRAGSLAPTLAYCMARLTEPGPGEVFLDPMCGAGTIAIERALAWPCKTVLCGDLDPEAVAATQKNAEAASIALDVRQWDACRLPLEDASVDKAATNMPYGKDVPLSDPAAFVSKLLRELARVIRPGGVLVILSARGRDVLKWLGRHSLFRRKKELKFRLYGFRATLLVLTRGGKEGRRPER